MRVSATIIVKPRIQKLRVFHKKSVPMQCHMFKLSYDKKTWRFILYFSISSHMLCFCWNSHETSLPKYFEVFSCGILPIFGLAGWISLIITNLLHPQSSYDLESLKTFHVHVNIENNKRFRNIVDKLHRNLITLKLHRQFGL